MTKAARSPRSQRPAYASQDLGIFNAAHILGLPPKRARSLLAGCDLTLEVVEELAAEHYPWRAHVDDGDSYWLTERQAAAVLGISVARVKQLLDQDGLPHVVHRTGVRLMRRDQVETIGNARLQRELRG